MAYDKRNNKYSTFFIDYFYDGFRGVHKENMQKSGMGKKPGPVCKMMHLFNAVSLLQKTRVECPSMSVELRFTQKTIEKQCS